MSVGIQRLRDDADAIRRGAVAKGEDPAVVEAAIALDAERGKLLGGTAKGAPSQLDQLPSSQAMKEARQGRRRCRQVSGELGSHIAEARNACATVETELDGLMLRVPNPPDTDVPVGAARLTKTVREWGEPIAHDAAVGSATPLGSGRALGMLDLAAGAKIRGSGFPIYRGAGARLQRALINLFMDLHTNGTA